MSFQPPFSHSRKSISNWLRNIPYSQNLNDGVLYCKVLSRTDSSFPKFIQIPRTEYDNVKNFRIIQKYLQKEKLYEIVDVSKFAGSKDFFEFSSWLYGYYEKKMRGWVGEEEREEGERERQEKGKGSSRKGSTSRIEGKEREKENIKIKINMKESTVLNKDIDFYQAYQTDTKSLLTLTARKDDIQCLEKMLKDMEQIIAYGQSIEDIKDGIRKRFYGDMAYLL